MLVVPTAKQPMSTRRQLQLAGLLPDDDETEQQPSGPSVTERQAAAVYERRVPCEGNVLGRRRGPWAEAWQASRLARQQAEQMLAQFGWTPEPDLQPKRG